MNEAQKRLLEMYKDIRQILESHDITFYVQYGTAIGALRHDGFIPWDDDIDILLWEKDMELAGKVLSEELDSDRYWYHESTADTHPHVIYRGDDLEKGLMERNAPFIDLFPIDVYPEGKLRSKLANILIWGNVGTIWAIDHVKSLTLHRMLCWVPRVFKRMEIGICERDTRMTVVYSTGFGHCIFPADYYGKPFKHVFEDDEVPLPHEIDKMLTHIFGDYMTPPPEDKRTGAGGFPCSVCKDLELEMRRNRPRSGKRLEPRHTLLITCHHPLDKLVGRERYGQH